MRKSADSPTDAARAFKVDRALRRSMLINGGEAACIVIARRSARSTLLIATPCYRHGKDSPLVHFHLCFFETGGAHEFVHLCRGASSHDPGLAFAVAQNARDEFHL